MSDGFYVETRLPAGSITGRRSRVYGRLRPRDNRFHGNSAIESCTAGLVAAVICAMGTICSSDCCAQVLEIGDNGAQKVYDGPAVFTEEGSTPIATARARSLRHRTSTTDIEIIGDAAQAAELSPALVGAVAWQESRMMPGLVSRAGAIGEMQLMPSTARDMGVDPYDTRQNYGGGAAYLRMLVNHYDGDLVRTLAAYNAGPKAVDRYGGVPPFKETQAFVAAIMNRLSQQTGAGDVIEADK